MSSALRGYPAFCWEVNLHYATLLTVAGTAAASLCSSPYPQVCQPPHLWHWKMALLYYLPGCSACSASLAALTVLHPHGHGPDSSLHKPTPPAEEALLL